MLTLPRFPLPERVRRSDRVAVSEDVAARVTALLDDGRHLDAFEVARSAGPLQAWSGARALVAGARLAHNLLAPRLGMLLTARAQREHPGHPAAAGPWCHHLLARRGPLLAWRAALETEARIDAGWAPGEAAEVIVVRAIVAATYRDGGTSAALLARARATAPDAPWILVCAAHVAELEDRREDSLALAQEALARHPRSRAAIAQVASMLLATGRREEAAAVLERVAPTLQSPILWTQWFEVTRETAAPADLLAALDRVESIAPILEPPFALWIADARCRVHQRAGDLAAAAEAAARVGTPWHDALAERLRRPDAPRRRVLLPVPHLAQDHQTCAPATLAALSASLGRPVPQAEIVAAICYAGTSAQAQRRWCEEHGFSTREFRVTWDAARRLVDASIPFALETKSASGGHLQAVAGYDEARETLLLVDPASPELVEEGAEDFLEAHRMTGPRGLVLVPASEAGRLAGIDLPEAEAYDRHHAAEAALARWDRERAVEEIAALESLAPGHPLARLARLSLAEFDGDRVERLRSIDALLERFPRHGALVAWKLVLLRETGRREDRIDLLRAAIEAGVEVHAFQGELAAEWSVDARTAAMARRLLLAAHRAAPRVARTLDLLAGLEARDGDRTWSLDLRRFAAAFEDTSEDLARAWFDAAVVAGRAEEALDWLRRRSRALGSRSGGPAVTLAHVLERLARAEESLEVLREAAARRPEDGDSRLELASALSGRGDLAGARAQLDAARATSRPARWQRVEASIRAREGDLAGAEASWREVLAREPLALDAHREVAWHRAAREGPAAAVAFLEEACARFPHHDGLASLLHSWVRGPEPERAEAIARRRIEAEPGRAWWRRERALLLQRLGRIEEAVAEATAALEIEPRSPSSHGILAGIEEAAGRPDRARDGYREAVRLEVDYAWGIDRLLRCQASDEGRRADLAFVRGELVRQTSTGEGLAAYAECARKVLDPDALRADLEALRDLRPDLPTAWTELARQTLDAGKAEEAERIAEETTRRFAVEPACWRALATVRRRRGDAEGAARADRRRVEIEPDVAEAWGDLATHLRDAGDRKGAHEALEQGVRRHPLDPDLSLALARARHAGGDADGAWAVAARVVETRPDASEAWEALDAWASTPARRADLVARARARTSKRPGEAQAWTRLAEVLPPTEASERKEALERAIALAPRDESAYDLLAWLLAEGGQYEEARAVLRRGPWSPTERPVGLEGREAWILASEGRLREAIERMLHAVERSSGYWWGWLNLAEWAQQTDDRATWERAAGALLRLSPGNPTALVVAADVALRAGRAEEGRERLRQALRQDPQHAHASRRLLQVGCEAKDPALLEDLATRLPAEGRPRWTAAAARAVSAALRGRREAMVGEASALVRAPDAPTPVAAIVDETLATSVPPRERRAYRRLLDDAVRAHEAAPAFARRWALRRLEAERWSAVRRFDRWLPPWGGGAEEALGELLDEVGRREAAGRVVPRLLRLHGDRLRADTTLWGKVGYALAASRRYREAVQWLAGIEERPDAEPWMVWNLAVALRKRGRHREAEALSLAVVSRGRRDRTWPDHVAYAAYGEALAGRHASARAVLARDAPPSSGGDVPARRRLLREMAASLCGVGEAPDRGQARSRLAEAIGRLGAAARGLQAAEAGDCARYAETLGAMGRAAGVRVAPWRRRWPGARPRGARARTFWWVFVAGLLASAVSTALRHLR